MASNHLNFAKNSIKLCACINALANKSRLKKLLFLLVGNGRYWSELGEVQSINNLEFIIVIVIVGSIQRVFVGIL